MADHARRVDLGGRIDHAADRPAPARCRPRCGRRDRPRRHACPRSGPASLWKYHQGTPFCMRHDRGVRRRAAARSRRAPAAAPNGPSAPGRHSPARRAPPARSVARDRERSRLSPPSMSVSPFVCIAARCGAARHQRQVDLAGGGELGGEDSRRWRRRRRSRRFISRGRAWRRGRCAAACRSRPSGSRRG